MAIKPHDLDVLTLKISHRPIFNKPAVTRDDKIQQITELKKELKNMNYKVDGVPLNNNLRNEKELMIDGQVNNEVLHVFDEASKGRASHQDIKNCLDKNFAPMTKEESKQYQQAQNKQIVSAPNPSNALLFMQHMEAQDKNAPEPHYAVQGDFSY